MLWMLLACLDAAPPAARPVVAGQASGDTGTGSGAPTAASTASTGGGDTGSTSGLGPSGETGGGVDSSGTSTTGDTSDTSDTAATGDTGLVPLIDEALLARCDPTTSLATGAGGDDLFRVTLPAGRCNDGTPAVAYVRAATDPGHLGDWVISFDGGNRCSDGEACSVRWCGEDFYNARKMSSRWEAETRSIEGLHGRDPRNSVAGWNHVQVPYCTSDNWMGQRGGVVLTDSQGTDLRVHFEGALVVDALFDALEGGVASDDGQATLPPLGGAARVVLAGSSAGAQGVMAHLDRVATRLAPVEVVGVLDGMSGPSDAHLTPAELALADASAQQQWDDDFVAVYDAQVDDSCLVDAPAAWQCVTPTPVQFDHLATPYFLHFDLRDSLIQDVFAGFGLSGQGFADATAATLHDLADARPEVGVHGSSCTQHVYLETDAWFHDQLLEVDGVSWSVHDGLAAWLDGAGPTLIDDPLVPRSVCP